MKRMTLILLSFILMAALGCSTEQNTNKQSATQNTNRQAAAQKDMAVPLVKGFPSDFPLIEGKVTASMENSLTDAEEGRAIGTGYYTQIKTDMTVQQAMDFYKPKFTKMTKQNPPKKGSPAMYSGFINKHPVTIYFVEQKDKTMLTIVLSGGKEK